jgi:uncharacterized protein
MALLGICLANFPEFSLYSFQKPDVVAAYPTAGIDRVIHYLQYIFIDGKFYSIFSLLFGVGFSIIISNPLKTTSFFLRRMIGLAIIGFLHLMFVWAGDILLLYALLGMLLPLFRNVSDRKLLITAAVLILIPVAMDAFKEITAGQYDLAKPAIRATQYYNAQYGITDENFPVWLRDAKSYPEMMKFMVPGVFIRCREFIDGNRYFKVLGLFLIGLYIGRHKIYADLQANKALFKRLCAVGLGVGLPVSCFYAWSAMNGEPAGLTVHTAAYALSVVPVALGYVGLVCLAAARPRHCERSEAISQTERDCFVPRNDASKHRHCERSEAISSNIFAFPGRMALTNYILQSVFGIIIYYGMFYGLGASMGLVYVELVALAVFAAEILLSMLWLKYFAFGPLEWLWRMFTYKRYFKLLKR